MKIGISISNDMESVHEEIRHACVLVGDKDGEINGHWRRRQKGENNPTESIIVPSSFLRQREDEASPSAPGQNERWS